MTDISLYLPAMQGGGAERAMVTLANGLAARGRGVDLVLASAEGPYIPEVSREVRVINLQSRGVLSSLPGLVRYLRRERPCAVLSALTHANVIAVLARAVARVPTRLVISERTNLSGAAAEAPSFRHRGVLLLMPWAYRRADGIIAVSHGVADDLARVIGLPRNRIEVVYNPVVMQDLLARANASLEHPWSREDQPPFVLAVGRLTMAKDYPTLIRAFARVRERRNCRLVILGEGELRKPLQALIERLGIWRSVQMPGFADNPFAWMRRASVFVLSSAWEGLPTVLIEAMACGTRVVSTDCPSGPCEILEGGKWGPLVPVGDSDALADAIIAQLDSPSQKNVQERGAFFNLENALDGYLSVLNGEGN